MQVIVFELCIPDNVYFSYAWQCIWNRHWSVLRCMTFYVKGCILNSFFILAHQPFGFLQKKACAVWFLIGGSLFENVDGTDSRGKIETRV